MLRRKMIFMSGLGFAALTVGGFTTGPILTSRAEVPVVRVQATASEAVPETTATIPAEEPKLTPDEEKAAAARLVFDRALVDAAVFLDDHVLPWVPDFCLRVASRARHPFHAGTCLITRALLAALRDDLTLATDRPPQVHDHAWKAQEDRARRQVEAEADRPFVPGLGEGW